MKYRTTCPHCASVFRLGPDQLDAVAGWVQCGVCGAPFDAWPTLLQEDGAPLTLPTEPPPAPSIAETAQPVGTPGASSPAIAATAEAPAAAMPAADEAPATPTQALGIVERARAEDLSSIILVDPDQPADDDFGPLPVVSAQPSMPPVYPPLARPAAVISTTAPVPAAARPEDSAPHRAEHGLDSEAPTAAPAAGRPRGFAWAWSMASVLLLATLLGQAAYFLRDTLAAELPQTRPTLERACALLGCTVELPRQIGQLRIVGSDLQTEATERLRLTLTLGNRSAQAQAWPVLVLTLTDPQGQALARRSFAPSEYLGDAARIAAGVPPRSEHPLSLPLSVRDLKPMGFDLRLTY